MTRVHVWAAVAKAMAAFLLLAGTNVKIPTQAEAA
jgi:hypothetical protein